MAINDQPDPPTDLPVEDTDTSATPPENAAAPAKAAPLDDVVASLIDEKPRPHLSVVPPPSDSATAAAVDDAAAPDQPEAAGDGAGPREEGVKVNLSQLLELGGLTGGLRQLAGWIEKQLPSLNEAVGKFLKQVEVVITSPDAFPVPRGTDPANAASTPPLTVVPAPPAEAKDAVAEIQTPVEPGPGEPAPVGDPQPEPTPGPAPIHDPEPTPDPNPQPDPVPIRDPEPMPDPNPGNDPLPIRDPPPPLDPDPGRDPLPIGDPIGDPAPMRDPIITGEAKPTDPEGEPDPFATD